MTFTPETIDPRLKHTATIVAAGGFVQAENAGQKKAQLEVARILERWHDRPGSVINKQGEINVDTYREYLRDIQNEHRLTGPQNDAIVGPRTLPVLTHVIIALDERDKQRAEKLQRIIDAGPSCELPASKTFKKFDCMGLKLFVAKDWGNSPEDELLRSQLEQGFFKRPFIRTADVDEPTAPSRLVNVTNKPSRERS